MNWEALGASAELVGAVGVIASLLYVSMQIRQNTQATRLATSNAISAAFRDWSRPLLEDPDLAKVFYVGVEDISRLNESEQWRFFTLCFSFLRMFEDIHYQFRHGSLEQEVWEGYATNYGLYATAPGMRVYWKARRDIFHPAFRQFIESYDPPIRPRIDALIAELEPEASDGAS